MWGIQLKKYRVGITKTVSCADEFIVEANSPNEASEIATQMMQDSGGGIEYDYADYSTDYMREENDK